MYKKLDKSISLFENTVLVAGLLSSALILFINVILRYFFHSGLHWAEEYTKFAIIWVTFAGCGAAVRSGAHLKITIFLDTLSGRKRHFLEMAILMVNTLFALLMVIKGGQYTAFMMGTGQRTSALEIPLWTVYIAIPIGGALMLVRFAEALRRGFRGESTNIWEEELL